VHPIIYEHFGISVVEAMASGCVSIVHRSGGSYTDIADHDKYVFSFEDVEDLAEKSTCYSTIMSYVGNTAEGSWSRQRNLTD